MTEKPFTINISDEALDHLQQKLATVRFPDEIEGAGWEYGAPLADIRRLVSYWKSGYDWRKQEATINSSLSQFTRNIQVDGFGDLNIHYVHHKSDVTSAIPLLFVHGWPGSFLEVQQILPMLLKGSSEFPAFHVVAISNPGFGFSEGPTKKGFVHTHYAEVAHKLMLALGYNQYVTQGGDWGYVITRTIAHLYGHKNSMAWHTNMPITAAPSLTTRPLVYLADIIFGYSEREKYSMARSAWYFEKTAGYFQEQATAPQTLGYSLADSPVGLLAWLYEKFVLYSGKDYKWDDDEVLTWVSIYWFSRAGPTGSLRIYYEAVKKLGPKPFTSLPDVTIPTGYSFFPDDLAGTPRRWLKAPNVVFMSEHSSGGHFASTEKPEELVGDLRRMFGKGGPAFGAVPGKTGYD